MTNFFTFGQTPEKLANRDTVGNTNSWIIPHLSHSTITKKMNRVRVNPRNLITKLSSPPLLKISFFGLFMTLDLDPGWQQKGRSRH